jgi:hypothetical protein
MFRTVVRAPGVVDDVRAERDDTLSADARCNHVLERGEQHAVGSAAFAESSSCDPLGIVRGAGLLVGVAADLRARDVRAVAV